MSDEQPCNNAVEPAPPEQGGYAVPAEQVQGVSFMDTYGNPRLIVSDQHSVQQEYTDNMICRDHGS